MSRPLRKIPPPPPPPPPLEDRVAKGREAEGELWRMGRGVEGWTEAEGDKKSGIHVYWKPGVDGGHCVWKCCGEVSAAPEDVYRLMLDTETMPAWNKDIQSYRVLETIDPSTDVVHCTSVNSTISARDFVLIRRHVQKDAQHWIIADINTEHSIAPPVSGVVRGWNGPGGIIIQAINPNKSWVCWVLNKDLKGWVPRTLIDQRLAQVLITWLKALRARLAPLPTPALPALIARLAPLPTPALPALIAPPASLKPPTHNKILKPRAPKPQSLLKTQIPCQS